jgi:GR25 family glycosyltransferase involved in LPS biosynthesis
MKYTIISLNDDRIFYKNMIRKRVQYEEIIMPGFDARSLSRESILGFLESRGLEWRGWDNAKRGEIGVWLSNFDRWELASTMDEPLIVFEDDAMPSPAFNIYMDEILEDLPEDYDFISLWIPDNQKNDYLYDIDFNENGEHIWTTRPWRTNETSKYRLNDSNRVALAFQGYGMVSLMYSPKGAAKLVDLAREVGVTGPVDCWLFQQAHKGLLEGYSCHPHFAHVVRYDNWGNASHAQHTEKAK